MSKFDLFQSFQQVNSVFAIKKFQMAFLASISGLLPPARVNIFSQLVIVKSLPNFQGDAGIFCSIIYFFMPAVCVSFD